MKTLYRNVMVVGLLLVLSAGCFAADPVPLPCAPEDCPPIDPCKIAPERCKDQGGPISSKKDASADIQKKNKTEKSDDSCKWCEPCSPTPGSECLKCCAK